MGSSESKPDTDHASSPAVGARPAAAEPCAILNVDSTSVEVATEPANDGAEAKPLAQVGGPDPPFARGCVDDLASAIVLQAGRAEGTERPPCRVGSSLPWCDGSAMGAAVLTVSPERNCAPSDAPFCAHSATFNPRPPYAPAARHVLDVASSCAPLSGPAQLADHTVVTRF